MIARNTLRVSFSGNDITFRNMRLIGVIGIRVDNVNVKGRKKFQQLIKILMFACSKAESQGVLWYYGR